MKKKGCSKTLAKNILKQSYQSKYENHDWFSIDNNITGNLQAHHLIPAETISTKRWVTLRDSFQYDLNEWQNGIFLPSETKIGCHLKVPIHRGNHNRGLNYEMALVYVESGIPIPDEVDLAIHKNGLTYLEEIRSRLDQIDEDVKDGEFCDESEKINFIDEMRELAKNAVTQIDSFTWCLTRWGKDYNSNSLVGCANGKTEGKKKARSNCECRVEPSRLHHQYDNKTEIVMSKITLEVGK